MPVPNINEQDVASILPDISNIEYFKQGGQKRVFKCEIDGNLYVVKFILVEDRTLNTEYTIQEGSMPLIDAVTARAEREVDTMANLDVPTLVKLGPIGLRTAEVRGQSLLYFAEEFIDGLNLREILEAQRNLPISDIVNLGTDVAEAIDAIWSKQRVHRDIKPENIVKRNDNGRFTLLDAGFVFDLRDISLTAPHIIVGTKTYMSPDQIQYTRKRQLDFRSDLFSLGVVLYESATGLHPFAYNAVSTEEVFARIFTLHPTPPTTIRTDIPVELEQIITQLLQKLPHLRYRSCQHLIDQLREVTIE